MRMQKTILATALVLTMNVAQAAGNLVDVRIVDRTSGSTQPEFYSRGKVFVPGDAGREFSVELSNHTGERVMVVLSVDGVNAITGETASGNQDGYVLEAYETATIDGWRKNLDTTAAFYFTNLGNSYAARTGRPQNVGVIGAAVFREARSWRGIPRWSESRRNGDEEYGYGRDDNRYKSAPAPEGELSRSAPSASSDSSADKSYGYAGNGAAQPQDSLGTGHGRREYNPVDTTTFNRRRSYADETVSVFYDATANLIAAGIMPRYSDRDRYARREPQAFPNGFVPDPRW
jgi:hypothetical protein